MTDKFINLTDTEKLNYINEIAKLFDNQQDDILDMCYCEESNCTIFSLRCNDYFFWGCGDAEDIEPDDLELLKKSIKDCVEAYPDEDKFKKQFRGFRVGLDLFICRKRKMRPQGMAYPSKKELWPLFDACGEEREVGLGNPYKPGER